MDIRKPKEWHWIQQLVGVLVGLTVIIGSCATLVMAIEFDSEGSAARSLIIDAHKRDVVKTEQKFASSEQQYTNDRVQRAEEEIRKWEYELRRSSTEEDREWIRSQIKKLERKIACIQAGTC